jgi:hypothetical protein
MPDQGIESIELRKLRLLSDSEQNRAGLVQELDALSQGFREATRRPANALTLITAAVQLLASLAQRPGRASAVAPRGTNWLQSFLSGVQTVQTLVSFFRRPNKP